jgi:hypothetical protein
MATSAIESGLEKLDIVLKEKHSLKNTKHTYTAVAFNPNSYVYRNGVKLCDDVADCGHQHKSWDAAYECYRQQKDALTWNNCEIRDENGIPVEFEHQCRACGGLYTNYIDHNCPRDYEQEAEDAEDDEEMAG